nr:MAG TPA: hypothetical protein [Caudoviricetes sp.]
MNFLLDTQKHIKSMIANLRKCLKNLIVEKI